MNQPRERIPVENQYLNELGRTTYNFAYLEWGIIWLTETIQNGFLSDAKTLTAGQIAVRFLEAVTEVGENEPDKQELTELAIKFNSLVKDRNQLMHGNPFTANGGEQRLKYNGKHGQKDWTTELMQEFADNLALCSIEAGKLLHGGRY